VLGEVLDSLESIADPPAFFWNVLGTLWVDVAAGATGVANGVGVGLLLPIGVLASRLLSKARSQGLKRVLTGLVSRVVVQTGVILITVTVVPVIVFPRNGCLNWNCDCRY